MPITACFFVPHPPLIIPAVGGGRERGIARTIGSYRAIAAAVGEISPETIVFITPHGVIYSDYIHISPGGHASGSFARYGAPEARYETEYDTEFINRFVRLLISESISAGTDCERDASLDHGVMIPMHFINEIYSGYKSVRVSISGFGHGVHYRVGQLMREASGDTKTVVVASGDLSHKLTRDGPYGFAKEGPEFDKRVADIIAGGDLRELLDIPESLSERAAECGLRCLIMMAGAVGEPCRQTLMSYEGPFGVGYLAASFLPEDPYVKLARDTLEGYIKTKKVPPAPENLPAGLTGSRAGVFVSIKKRGELRGCIGTIAPTQNNIAEEIIQNAVSSGTKDPRFYPVDESELPELAYSVDVLFPPEPISSFDELDVLKYGVIVTSGYRRGLLLPNLDGVDAVSDQVSIALKKAGIGPGEKYDMERFEVARHK